MWFGDAQIAAAPQDLATSEKPLEARMGFQFFSGRSKSRHFLRFSLTLDSALRMTLRRPVTPSYATELPVGIALPITLQGRFASSLGH
jgi:hypothetical protein